MIEPPTQAASCSPGSLRIATGAALFACTNAAATALYRRGGASVVSLYVIRSPIVYVANVLLVALQEGRPAATNVLLLRTGSATATRLALTRSLLNSLKQILLSIAFVYLTYAGMCMCMCMCMCMYGPLSQHAERRIDGLTQLEQHSSKAQSRPPPLPKVHALGTRYIPTPRALRNPHLPGGVLIGSLSPEPQRCLL